ncbi:hypothetical protein ACFCX0_16830, partial [Streptomyces sp. NPDC056352]
LRSAELRAAGFPIIRVKIEASPWNADIAQTADEAASLSPACHAVLPAEHPPTRLSPRLQRTVLGPHASGFGPDTVRDWRVDRSAFHAAHRWVDGDADGLRERLATALAVLLERTAAR